jgi:hypothetical protein
MVGVGHINVFETKIGGIHGQNDIGTVLTKHVDEHLPKFPIIFEFSVL